MSQWAYVHGTITVSPMGRTQAEKRYILDTVLDHLPIVSGSEQDMSVYVVQKAGYNSWSSCNEFGEWTNNLVDSYGRKNKCGGLQVQTEYILVVDGSLRDRTFAETKKEFMKWLVRLAKRVYVRDVLIRVRSLDGEMTINEDEKFGNLEEDPSWVKRNKDYEPAWCEYLMWDRAKESEYPMKLEFKYYENPENGAEIARRLLYERGE